MIKVEDNRIKTSYLPFKIIERTDKILNSEGSYIKIGNLKLLKYKNRVFSVKYKHKDLARLLVLTLLKEKIDKRLIEIIDKNIGIPTDLKKKIKISPYKKR